MAFYQMPQCWPFNAINPSLFAEFLTLIRKFIIILLLLTRKNYCNINYNNNNNNNNSNNNNNNNNNNYKECTNLKSQIQRNIQYCFSSSPVFIIMVMILCETCAYPIHGGGVSASVHNKQTRSIADLYVNRHHTHHQHQQKHQYQHHNISTSSSTSSLSSAASLSSTIAAASMAARDLTSIENDGDMTDFIAASPSSSSSSSSSLSRHLQLGTKENTGCPSTTSSHCLRCNSEGCIKCPVFLVTDSRQCVERCPAGYIDQWSAHTEFMGRVCVTTGYSGALMAALAGMFGGFLICLSILAIAVMVMKRRRRRKTIKQKLINENSMDRSDFLRQLNEMRPNAEYFLAMLNDTRRQIRKLYLSGDIVAANSYRPIVRDLARILILLNRPIELIPGAPHDWNRLYSWSEQVLERYRPQVGQLIDFFQTPGHVGVDVDEFDAHSVYRQKAGGGGFYRQSPLQSTSNLTTTTSNTIKSQKMHIFGSLISLHEFEEPRPSDPFGSSFNTLKNGNLITDLNASSLWLEDEFYKLGFRPQDEITTEL